MKNFLFALILSLALSSSAYASFDDVPSTSPYYEGVSYLELLGAVKPGEDFRPDDPVTRAEFFKILFKTIGVETEESKTPFKDVPETAWFATYAALANQNGLATGENFLPEGTFNRGTALGLLMKAYGLSAPIIPPSARIAFFKDIGVKHPLYCLLAQATSIGVLEPDLSVNFKPYQTLTRGEMAELIYNLEVWQNASNAEAVNDDFYKSDIFANIWARVLNEFYLPAGYEIDQDVLFEAAVKAVLTSLNDPYSVYFTSAEATEFMDALEGEFEGVGIILTQDEDLKIYITEILENSPAEDSELTVGDQITAVDGVSIENMYIEEILKRIKGAAGTEVKLTILREQVSYTYALQREQIELDLVKGKIYHGDAWFIDIDSFASDIYEDMMGTLATLTEEEPDPSAIILDLRGNPGGYVNMANFIAGMFVPQFTTLVTLDYGGHQESIVNGDKGAYQDIPVYILVNEYSASASEILAQTLKEEADATIIGTQTFGKGTAQELVTYWDGSVLKLTIANWLSSQGNSIQGVGVTPDIVITETEGETDPWLKALNDAL